MSGRKAKKLHTTKPAEPQIFERSSAGMDYPGKHAAQGRYYAAEGKGAAVALVMTLTGLMGAAGIFVAVAVNDFAWGQLAYYIPGLAVSALLIFAGARRLKRK